MKAAETARLKRKMRPVDHDFEQTHTERAPIQRGSDAGGGNPGG
jgi:hypothetical protein